MSKVLIKIYKNYKLVIENYFFMTILRVLNSLFYFIILPYLITNLGIEKYGLYVYVMSIVNYLIVMVTFGFDFPAVKEIVENQDNSRVKENILSQVFTAKIILVIPLAIVYLSLTMIIPSMNQNWELFLICFVNIFANILSPYWFFQGIQKMKIVTYIQVALKLVSLPLIFLMVNEPNDVWKFALIVTLTNFCGSLIASFIIYYYEKLHIRLIPFSKLKNLFTDALPFFWSNAAGVIKYQSTLIIIGSLFGMSDVAVYDLAYKIFSIPNIIFSSVNGALFPKISKSHNKSEIKKILYLETIAGFFVIIIIFLLGEKLIMFLGGEEMLYAYPISVALSFGILTYLLVGGYINFLFVPNKKYSFVTKNQIIAFTSFFSITILGLLLWTDILVIAIAFSISGIIEIFYCKYLIKKHKLLE
jgi:polysaccharide transporter, PST family